MEHTKLSLKCPDCDFETSSKSYLFQHLAVAHNRVQLSRVKRFMRCRKCKHAQPGEDYVHFDEASARLSCVDHDIAFSMTFNKTKFRPRERFSLLTLACAVPYRKVWFFDAGSTVYPRWPWEAKGLRVQASWIFVEATSK